MYLYEERLRAVELYTKLGKRPKAVIWQLGYPTKNSLRAWHEAYQKSSDVHASYVRRTRKYSDEQKSVAIECYINHGRCFAFTRKALGYDPASFPRTATHAAKSISSACTGTRYPIEE